MVIPLSATILVFHIHRVGLGQELFNYFNLIVIVMHPFMKESLKKDQTSFTISIEPRNIKTSQILDFNNSRQNILFLIFLMGLGIPGPLYFIS